MWPAPRFDTLFFGREQKDVDSVEFLIQHHLFLPLSPHPLKMCFVNAHSEKLFGNLSARIHAIVPVSKDTVLHTPTHYVWYIKEASLFFSPCLLINVVQTEAMPCRGTICSILFGQELKFYLGLLLFLQLTPKKTELISAD